MSAATMQAVRHPAKYSDVLMPLFGELLDGYDRVLDPFAGTGKLRSIRPDAYLLEIEPEWAAISGATVGDALDMPWDDGYFDAVCTSPTYGNRMADHFTDHQVDKSYRRNTYRHALGRELSNNNSGWMQWGAMYRAFHINAWTEVRRVLRPEGRFILNISDHIRNGERVPVSEWHRAAVEGLRFALVSEHAVETPRQRFGANGNARVSHEVVYVFRKEGN
jgi:SAM-dependent methyltransferase